MTMKKLIQKAKEKKSAISVIGLGYVGLPVAVVFAEAGFHVVGIDKNKQKIDQLSQGESSTSDVDSEKLHKVVNEDLLEFSQDFESLAETDATILCLPTPLTKYREPDTSYISDAMKGISRYLHEGQLVVLESTSYPGTTEELIVPVVEEKGFRVGENIYVAYSPERIDPGNKSYNFQDIPKVVGGVTDQCTDLAETLYKQVLNAEVHTVSSPKEAEMSKLLENIFRNVNIALVNELAQLADRMDIDIWEVIEAAKTKPYGFMPFYPGPGVGGHCIPVDPFYLSWKAKEYDARVRFIELQEKLMPRCRNLF